jgi:hypothetical protein
VASGAKLASNTFAPLPEIGRTKSHLSQSRASARQVDTGWRKKRMRKQEDRAPDLILSDRFAL